MKTRIYAMLAALFCCVPMALSQASPFSQNIFAPQVFTASGATGTPIRLNGLTSTTSTVGSSYNVGSITVAGTSLTTATFSVMGSSDNGATFYALPIYTVATPTATPVTALTVTANGLYQVNLVGLTHVEFVTSGTFNATNITLTFTASPNGSLSKNGAGTGGIIYPGAGVPCSTGSSWCLPYTSLNQLPANVIPLLNQPTTGNAATATALAATPTQCSGQFATGIQANGNANCGSGSGLSGSYSLSGQIGTFSNGALTAIGSPFGMGISCSAAGNFELGYSSTNPNTCTFSYSNGTPVSGTVADGTNTTTLVTPFTSGSLAFSYATNSTFTGHAVASSGQSASATVSFSVNDCTFAGVGGGGGTGATASGTGACLAGETATITGAGSAIPAVKLGNTAVNDTFSLTPAAQYIILVLTGGCSHSLTVNSFTTTFNTTPLTYTNYLGGSQTGMCLYYSPTNYTGTYSVVVKS